MSLEVIRYPARSSRNPKKWWKTTATYIDGNLYVFDGNAKSPTKGELWKVCAPNSNAIVE
jgi:hypothetical protein